MANCKQIKGMLHFSFIYGFLTEQEFGVLYEAHKIKNIIFSQRDYDCFSLDNLEEAEIFPEFENWTSNAQPLCWGCQSYSSALSAGLTS